MTLSDKGITLSGQLRVARDHQPRSLTTATTGCCNTLISLSCLRIRICARSHSRASNPQATGICPRVGGVSQFVISRVWRRHLVCYSTRLDPHRWHASIT